MANTTTHRRRSQWAKIQMDRLMTNEGDALDLTVASHAATELELPPIYDAPQEGHVYLIESDSGLFKIGFAQDLAQRLRAVRCSSPVPCSLAFSIKTCDCVSLERLLHTRFKAKRVRGEWFALDAEDVRWIRALPEEM